MRIYVAHIYVHILLLCVYIHIEIDRESVLIPYMETCYERAHGSWRFYFEAKNKNQNRMSGLGSVLRARLYQGLQ